MLALLREPFVGGLQPERLEVGAARPVVGCTSLNATSCSYAVLIVDSSSCQG